MNLVSVDRFEAAPSEERLRVDGEQIELAKTSRYEPVEQLSDEPSPETVAPVIRTDGDRPDQRCELVRFGAATTDDLTTVACDHECPEVLLDTVDHQRRVFQQIENFRKIAGARSTYFQLFQVDHDSDANDS